MRWALALSFVLACSPVSTVKPTPEATRSPAPEQHGPGADAGLLAEMASVLCRGEGPESPRDLARKVLHTHGEAAIERLLSEAVSPGACHEGLFQTIAQMVIQSQLACCLWDVTPAFVPIRSALESGSDRRVLAALPVIRWIGQGATDLTKSGYTNGAWPLNDLVSEIDEVLDRLNQKESCVAVMEIERETARFSAAYHPPPPPKVRRELAHAKKQPYDPLSQRVLVCRMRSIEDKLAACYAQHKVSGRVLVEVVISPAGTLSSAQATGAFADTPTGACVENAVKTLTFPPSSGRTMEYPFVLGESP